MKRKNKKIVRILIPFLLLIFLPLLILNFTKIKKFITRAAGVPANIEVNSTHTLEPINQFWKNFSQGGESSDDMIAPVVNEIKALSPQYIRIDHIYDHYNVVSKNNGQIVMNFSDLDKMVASILKTGALPFFSLSYMPSSIAENGDITGKPIIWNDWTYVVQKTIEHYSGTKQYNLNNIFYEVWNEPDLFGKWKYYGDKNYLTLYSFAAIGANNATNVNKFSLGGPAITAFYKNWIETFIKYTIDNKIRLDFLSWHRYSINPQQFTDDLKDANDIAFDYENAISLPKIISEWGFTPEINSGYDSYFSAAHTIATVRKVPLGYKYMFAFEPVDGKSPQNQEYWGRWGLLTHPDFGKKIKPRYLAFAMLNKLSGTRLLIKGEGTYVTGLAAKDSETVKLILVNFDPDGINSQNVPIKIINLTPGDYEYKSQRLGQSSTAQQISLTDTVFSNNIILTPNTAIFLELTPVASSSSNLSN